MISVRGRSLLQTRAEQHSDPDHRPSLGGRGTPPYSLTTTVLSLGTRLYFSDMF